MVDTLKEKQRMDELVEAFRGYIREQNYFDIVYSEKIGYLRIVLAENADETVIRLGSFDEILETLIDDMLMEEAEKLPKTAIEPDYQSIDLEKVRGRLLEIFENLQEKAYCTAVMERQLTQWMQQ